MGNTNDGTQNNSSSSPKRLTIDDIVIRHTLMDFVLLCEGAVYCHLYEQGQLHTVPFDNKGVILQPFSVTIPISLNLSGYPPKDMFIKDVKRELPKILQERNGWSCCILDNNTLLITPDIYFREPQVS